MDASTSRRSRPHSGHVGTLSERARFDPEAYEPDRTLVGARALGGAVGPHDIEVATPDGIRAPLTAGQQTLATSYIPLARNLARRRTRLYPAGSEEFEAVAYLALVEAAQSFDPARRVGFATFARHRILGALFDAQRQLIGGGLGGRIDEAPSFEAFDRDSERRGQVLGIRPSPTDDAMIDAIDAVEGWTRRLPRTHARAIHQIYVEGKSQDETATALGLSRSHISRVHNQTLTWLGEARRLDD